jgi:hypothetical protein
MRTAVCCTREERDERGIRMLVEALEAARLVQLQRLAGGDIAARRACARTRDQTDEAATARAINTQP